MGYFQITNPMQSVYRLEDPRGVFLTLLVGNRSALLVDTGMGIGNAAKAVKEITALPLLVANTHGHIDHIGGNYQFHQVYLEKEDFALARDWSNREKKLHILSMEPGHIPADFDRDAFFSYEAEHLKELKNGNVFDLGGVHVIAVRLPGHTRGSMGFLCPERQLLITGDSISSVVYLVFPESCPLSGYMDMLRSTKELEFSHMLSAHCKELLGKEFLDTLIRCAQSIRPEDSFFFRNPLLPEYRERMFVYRELHAGREAAIVYSMDKFDLE